MKLKSQTILPDQKELDTYLFSTENLDGYMGQIADGKKSALTVTASGDQIIAMAKHGITDITAFDYNPNAEPIAELKLSALQHLNLDEFWNFFTQSYDAFDEKTYQTLKHGLTDQSREFWDTLYVENKNHGPSIWHGTQSLKWQHHFDPKDPNLCDITYLQDPTEYKKAQQAVENLDITFLNTSIIDLEKHLAGQKFDIGIFSNIAGHFKREERSKQITFPTVIGGLLENTDTIQAEYLWRLHDEDLQKYLDKYSRLGKVSHLRFPATLATGWYKQKTPLNPDCIITVEK